MTINNVGRVVVPFDFTEHSLEALRSALGMTSQPEDVHLLHVLPGVIAPFAGFGVWKEKEQGRINGAKNKLDEFLADPEFAGIRKEVRVGAIEFLTAQHARDCEAELIVVGSHGRTDQPQLVTSSVAEEIGRLAPCPVMMVKLPHEDRPTDPQP